MGHPHICLTCQWYTWLHCEIYGHLHYEKTTSRLGCNDWRLSDDYKKGGKFYEEEANDENPGGN